MEQTNKRKKPTQFLAILYDILDASLINNHRKDIVLVLSDGVIMENGFAFLALNLCALLFFLHILRIGIIQHSFGK